MQSHAPRIITLDACIKIAPSNQSHVFTVSKYLTKDLTNNVKCLFIFVFICRL